MTVKKLSNLLLSTFFDCAQTSSSGHLHNLTFNRELSPSTVNRSSSSDRQAFAVYGEPGKTEIRYRVSITPLSITLLCAVIFLLSVFLVVVGVRERINGKYLHLCRRKLFPCAYHPGGEIEATSHISLLMEENSQNI